MLLEDEEVHAHSRVLAVNYLGVYHTVKACLPGMLARRSGHVLFIGSLMAMYGVAQSAGAVATAPCGMFTLVHHAGAFAGGSYCAAKAAVRGLADSLRLEVGCAPSRARTLATLSDAVWGCTAAWHGRGRVHLPARPCGHAPGAPGAGQPAVGACTCAGLAGLPGRRSTDSSTPVP